MNGRAQQGRDRLERIAALLLSLSRLAETAASRSAPVRFIVLWLLRYAEEVAADFVGMQPDAALWQEWLTLAEDTSGYGPTDALALALSLRLLALAVQAMAQDAARHPDEAEMSGFMGRIGRIGLAPIMSAPLAVECVDTS